MSHRPDHDRSTRTLLRMGSSSSVCSAVFCRNPSVDCWLYVVYGSISDPISTSPRSVWLMYTCRPADTMITCRNGLSGSVTKACNTCVVIGSSTRAIADTSLDQPATQG